MLKQTGIGRLEASFSQTFVSKFTLIVLLHISLFGQIIVIIILDAAKCNLTKL